MPITPLHLGLLAPIEAKYPNKVSHVAFLGASLIMDARAIAYHGLGVGAPILQYHPPTTHSLLAAVLIASLLALVRRQRAWVIGAYLGAVSHILLDGFVHSDLSPLYPMAGNPLYWNGYHWVSGILSVLFVWLLLQYVDAIKPYIHRLTRR